MCTPRRISEKDHRVEENGDGGGEERGETNAVIAREGAEKVSRQNPFEVSLAAVKSLNGMLGEKIAIDKLWM